MKNLYRLTIMELHKWISSAKHSLLSAAHHTMLQRQQILPLLRARIVEHKNRLQMQRHLKISNTLILQENQPLTTTIIAAYEFKISKLLSRSGRVDRQHHSRNIFTLGCFSCRLGTPPCVTLFPKHPQKISSHGRCGY